MILWISICQAIRLLTERDTAPKLAAADLAAIGVAAQLGQSLAQSPWADALDAMQSQIGNMDFAAAQAHVDALLQRLGVQPAV